MNNKIYHLLSPVAWIALGICIGLGISAFAPLHETGAFVAAGSASPKQQSPSRETHAISETPANSKASVRVSPKPKLSAVALNEPKNAHGSQLEDAKTDKAEKGASSDVSDTPPWRLKEEFGKDLNGKLAELRKLLQVSEKNRASYSSKDTHDTSTVRVVIQSASSQEKEKFWQYVTNEASRLSPELRTFYEVDARRLLDTFLGFSQSFRLLYVISHVPPEGGGEEVVHYVFDTNSPADFGITDEGAVKAPPAITPFNHMQPWFDPVTFTPSARYSYLIVTGG